MADVGTLVVGAGVIGSAVAMHLAQMGEDVCVIDADLSGDHSSSERNAGGVRANWWQPVNVALAAATIDWLESISDEVGFRQHGYLWLYDAELWPQAREHAGLQLGMGREVDLLLPFEVAARFPMIDRPDGIAGATLTPRDGLVNANAVKEGLRRRARDSGARFLDRTALASLASGPDEERAQVLELSRDDASAYLEGENAAWAPSGEIGCRAVVNTAGPWADRVARITGGPRHSFAVRRQVALLASQDVDLAGAGMIVDTSGVYLHHEGGDTFLAGYSPPGDPPGIDFSYDGRGFFEAELWPRLAARMSGMDRLEYRGGWAGLYDMSEDASAVLGRIPGQDRRYEAHSFSGRGVMQSWAAGRAMAELILSGSFETIDASGLSAERFALGRVLPEPLHI